MYLHFNHVISLLASFVVVSGNTVDNILLYQLLLNIWDPKQYQTYQENSSFVKHENFGIRRVSIKSMLKT